ncbi:MAG: hypothetical protein K2G32_03985 [Oscillospiraceae bacterium]|nr:hypothetical protein [Oscillospiraceae bacterium]
MSTAVVNDSSSGKAPINKVISLGLMIFGVVEAVVAYFLVIGPLFIKPVYAQADSYNASGITCIVKLFGKTFASADEIANNQVILSLVSTIINIVIIYLIFSGALILLAFFFNKGYAFAKTYLIAIFGAKALIGISPLMIPFANIRNTMRIFGIADAVICIAICGYFVYLNAMEYADDMLMNADEIAAMKKRGIQSGVMFLLLMLSMIFEGQAMSALGGGNWSIALGWLEQTQVQQGIVPMLLVAIGLIAAVTHVRGADWGNFFFFSFGLSATAANIIGVINRFKSGGKFTTRTIFLILALVGALALTAFVAKGVIKKIVPKITPDDKKAAMSLLISAGSILLCFILTIVAVTMWDKLLYGGVNLGAMDYMYYVLYGGLTVFLLTAMMGGFGFTKFGTLALFLIVLASDFECIFEVLNARQNFIALNEGMKGYNYIIAAVIFILAIISCFGLIPVFAVKDVENYMYNKRFE